jgi:putative peptidoglycan binding protein
MAVPSVKTKRDLVGVGHTVQLSAVHRRPVGSATLRRLRQAARPALIASCVFVSALTVAKDPPFIGTGLVERAQAIVNQLRDELAMGSDVRVAVVSYHPLVFSVEPLDKARTQFRLSMELGFLMMLNDDELHAALAHELGHVWLYTHQPYLQSERIANDVGMRAVDRATFESVYAKLWAYERTTGVPLQELLGSPSSAAPPVEVAAVRPAPPVVAWATGFRGTFIVGLDGALYNPYRASTVQWVQQILTERGLYSGPANGILDTETMRAIYEFQRANGILQPCGVPTPLTRKLLEQGSHTDAVR